MKIYGWINEEFAKRHKAKMERESETFLCLVECIPHLVATIAALLGVIEHNNVSVAQNATPNISYSKPSTKSIGALLQEHGPIALIASTVRNPVTLELFISAVKNRGLAIHVLSNLRCDVPVCLFQHVPFREKGANIIVHCIHG